MNERFQGWMSIEDAGEKGARPTLWDEPGPGRVPVEVIVDYANDGRPMSFITRTLHEAE